MRTRLGDDTIGPYRVSTVRLEEPFRYIPGFLEPPSNEAYETMVFHKSDPWRDVYVARYATPEEAGYGHETIVARLKNGEVPPFEESKV